MGHGNVLKSLIVIGGNQHENRRRITVQKIARCDNLKFKFAAVHHSAPSLVDAHGHVTGAVLPEIEFGLVGCVTLLNCSGGGVLDEAMPEVPLGHALGGCDSVGFVGYGHLENLLAFFALPIYNQGGRGKAPGSPFWWDERRSC